jgi:DNA-binding NarL/FixJ family response regulator
MGADSVIIHSGSHRVGREVRSFLLRTGYKGKVIRVAANREFRKEVKRNRPALAFVESNCWYEVTPYVLCQYVEAYPKMGVAVFSYERLTASRAAGFINLGADSFIDLRIDDEGEIAEAFKKVINGGSYLPAWLDEAAGGYCLGIPEYSRVTMGEIAVLRLAGLGNSIGDMAVKLEAAEGTVRNHISNLHKKYGIHNQTEMIGLSLRLGVVLPDELADKTTNIEVLEGEVEDVYQDAGRRRGHRRKYGITGFLTGNAGDEGGGREDREHQTGY